MHRLFTRGEFGFFHVDFAQAIRVLEIERDTWRQVCDKLGGAKPSFPALDFTSEPASLGTSFVA